MIRLRFLIDNRRLMVQVPLAFNLIEVVEARERTLQAL